MKRRVTIREAVLEDSYTFMNEMTQERVNKLMSNFASMIDLRIAFSLAYDISKPLCWIAYVGDTAAAMFGCAPTDDESVGNAWMETTPAIKSARIAFVRQSRKYIEIMTETYPTLESCVESDNKPLLDLLWRNGFNIYETEGGKTRCVCRSLL